MCQWRWIDFNNRILSVQETLCDATGERWRPKDHELRRLDIKEGFVEYLVQERERQEALGMLGPFVLPAGCCPRQYFIN